MAEAVDAQQAKVRTALRTEVAPVLAAGTALTPQEKKAQDLAKTEAEKRANKEAPSIRQEVLSDAEARKKIQERFEGHERNAAGNLVDARLRAQEQTAIAKDALIRKLARGEYSAVPPTLTPAEKDTIISKISSGIDRLPGLTNLPARNTPERRAAIEAWLSDPKNAEFYAELLTQESTEIRGEGSAEEIDNAKDAAKIAEAERADLVAKIAKQQETVEQLDTDIQAFEAANGANMVVLTTNFDAARVNVEALSSQLELIKTRLDLLSREKTSVYASKNLNNALREARLLEIEANEVALTGHAAAATNQVAIARAQMERTGASLKLLQDQKEALDTKRDGAQTHWESLLNDYSSAELKLEGAYHEMYTASGDTDVLAENIEGSIEKAFIALIDKRMIEDATTMSEALLKIENEAKEAETRVLAKGIRTRYYRNVTARGIIGLVRGHESKKLDKEFVSNDWGIFFNHGPEVLVKRVLRDGGMTNAEAQAKVDDPEFMKTAVPEYMEQLIALRAKTSKISENEAEYIASFDWSEEIFNKAVGRNEKAQTMLDDLHSKGLIEDNTISALRRADKSSILKVLLAIFGGALTLGVAGVAAAAH